jgi:transposase InsO family protein
VRGRGKPCARLQAVCFTGSGGLGLLAAGLVGQDADQVVLGEPAGDRCRPQCLVDLGGRVQLGQRDRFGHLRPDRPGSGRSGLERPPAARTPRPAVFGSGGLAGECAGRRLGRRLRGPETVEPFPLLGLRHHRTPDRRETLYLCAVKDCASNRIVGYSICPRMTSELAVTALRNAIALLRTPHGTIVHSDRGGQFRSPKYAAALRTPGLVGSMGRVGARGDNAAMESFFALLQKNMLDRQRWATHEQLRLAIVTWIEMTYHRQRRQRRQRRLGRLTPIEFETIHTAVHAA